MTITDDEDLALLWRETGEEDSVIVRALARRAGWQGRAFQFAELGLGTLLLIAVAVAIGSNGAPATLLFGLLLAAAVVWQLWKRRTLYEASHAEGLVEREALLRAAHGRSARELRQARWALLLFPLGFGLAAFMKAAAATDGDFTHAAAALWAATATPETRTALLALAIGEVYFIHRSLRLATELRRIATLREEYRREAAIDAAAR